MGLWCFPSVCLLSLQCVSGRGTVGLHLGFKGGPESQNRTSLVSVKQVLFLSLRIRGGGAGPGLDEVGVGRERVYELSMRQCEIYF